MKKTEMKNKTTAKTFEFVDYTDAELIAFYDSLRSKVLHGLEGSNVQLPGIAGKYKLLLARL